ncbi:MAG: hypothetical protein WC058_05780 [Phycisphaeraceae bacterium]
MKSFSRSILVARRRCIAAGLLPVMLIGFCLTAPGNAPGSTPGSVAGNAIRPWSSTPLTWRAGTSEASRLFVSTWSRWNGGCETDPFHRRPLVNPLCSAALAQAGSPTPNQSFAQSVVTRRGSAPPPPPGRAIIFLRAPPAM